MHKFSYKYAYYRVKLALPCSELNVRDIKVIPRMVIDLLAVGPQRGLGVIWYVMCTYDCIFIERLSWISCGRFRRLLTAREWHFYIGCYQILFFFHRVRSFKAIAEKKL